MKAKDLIIEKWVNAPVNFELSVSSQKIKIIHVFQMLCPGCVYRGIPQTVELFNKYNSEDVVVVGMHSVFENHHAMLPEALDVFIKEWRLPFPVAIDKRIDDQWMPETMKAYHLEGTPSLIIIDHNGDIQLCSFGHVETEKLDTYITKLINEKRQLNKKRL